MKNIITISLLIALTGVSCMFTGRRVRGNGHVVTDNRQLPGFNGIELDCSFDVFLSEGSTNSVKIEAEENILPYIRTRVENGILRIETEDGVWLRTRRDVKIYVTAPGYARVHLNGSGNITGQTKISDPSKVDIDLTGSGDMKLEIDAPEVKAHITGSGDMTLRGETKKFSGDIDGSGDMHAMELKAEEAHMSISGSGDADIYGSVKLDINVNGSGDVHYKGNGQVNSNVSGSGEVKKAD